MPRMRLICTVLTFSLKQVANTLVHASVKWELLNETPFELAILAAKVASCVDPRVSWDVRTLLPNSPSIHGFTPRNLVWWIC